MSPLDNGTIKHNKSNKTTNYINFLYRSKTNEELHPEQRKLVDDGWGSANVLGLQFIYQPICLV